MASNKITPALIDDLNPAFLVSSTFTDLLCRIAKGEINSQDLAKQELAQRGLNINGQWIGFEQAKKQLVS